MTVNIVDGIFLFVLVSVILMHFFAKKPKHQFGPNVIYDGRSFKIKDEAALLRKAEMELKIINAQLGKEQLYIVRRWNVVDNTVEEIPLSFEELIRDGQRLQINMVDMGLIFWNHLREERGLEPISKTAIVGEKA